MRVKVPIRLLPHQGDFFLFDPEDRGPTIEAILGWWGSGKSIAAALKMFKACVENPYREEYGLSRPQAACLAPTARIVEKTIIPTLQKVFPPFMVTQEWKKPYPKWLLANGLELSFVSADANFEGESLCALWVDEIHHPVISNNTDRWLNLYSRVRDPLAPTLRTIVSGRPTAGWTREIFDLERLSPADRKNRQTMLVGTDDNPFLPEGQFEQIMTMVPAHLADVVRKGGWMMPPGALFVSYDDQRNILEASEVDLSQPIHVGIDIGVHSAAVMAQDRLTTGRNLVGQPKRIPGCFIVDEILGEHLGTEEMCVQVKSSRYSDQFIPGKSEIYVDPTIRIDELRIVQKHFPRYRVVKRDRKDPFYDKAPGIRVLQAAVLDGQQNVALWFNRALIGRRHGVLDAVLSARTTEKTGAVVKDDLRDHSLDALRYVAQGRLGTMRPIEAQSLKRV